MGSGKSNGRQGKRQRHCRLPIADLSRAIQVTGNGHRFSPPPNSKISNHDQIGNWQLAIGNALVQDLCSNWQH